MAITQSPIQAHHDPKQRLNYSYNSTSAITWDIGLAMIVVAVAGAFDYRFLGLHLSFMHCFVLAAGGLVSFYSGIISRQKAYVVNLALGAFFILNSILGFLVGDRGHIKLGYNTNEAVIVKFAPGFLELSTVDHIFHFMLGAFFILAAYAWKRKSVDFPTNFKRQRNS